MRGSEIKFVVNNTPCCPSKILRKHRFQKKMLMQYFVGTTKIVMAFLKKAYV